MENVKKVVGVGVYVIRNGKLLLGKRKGKHCPGTWAAAGGKIEEGENYLDAARRELREETGLNAVWLADAMMQTEEVHEHLGEIHTSITIVARIGETAEPKLLEPEKCECWEWFDLDNLPHPQFPALKALIDTGYQLPRTKEEFIQLLQGINATRALQALNTQLQTSRA